MRVGAVALAGLVAATALASCARGNREIPMVSADYRSWSRSTEAELKYPIPGHLDNYRIVYVNDIGRRYAVAEEDGKRRITYPEGTVFVKEVYGGLETPGPGESPKALTVMVKASQNAHAVRGWVWLIKDPQSGEETVVTQEFCAACHAAANDIHPYADRNPNREDRDCIFITPPRLAE